MHSIVSVESNYDISMDEQSLRCLEEILIEFFDAKTGNERKRQIDGILGNFTHQKDSWRYCLYYMVSTKNDFVIMYASTVIEKLIRHFWHSLNGQDKGEVRRVLSGLLTERHSTFSPCIRNKMIQLLVNIARVDWPHFYPDFFTNILKFIKQGDTTLLGLTMLLTACEELTCPRDDLSVARSQELKKLFNAQINTVLELLTGLLNSVLEKSIVKYASESDSGTNQSVFNSNLKFANNSPSNISSSLDPESHAIALTCLKCFSQLFSWIPLSQNISSNVLATVFNYTFFGTEPEKLTDLTASNATVGMQAIDCINEILSKNYLPPDFEAFLVQIFASSYQLLQRIVKGQAQKKMAEVGNGFHGNAAPLSSLNPDYMNKCTELFRLFLIGHLKRLDGNSHLPILEFLWLFHSYTFQQPLINGYRQCIEIWTELLDDGNVKLLRLNTTDSLNKYRSLIMTLLTQSLKTTFFRFNGDNLEGLDRDSSDNETDDNSWSGFLTCHVEFFCKVSELFPEETFVLIDNEYNSLSGAYCELERNVSNGRLNFSTENFCYKLAPILKDLATVLCIISAVCDHVPLPMLLVTNVSHLCAVAIRMKFFDVQDLPSHTRDDFVNLHSELFLVLKAFVLKLSQKDEKIDLIGDADTNEIFTKIINDLIEFCASTLGQRVDAKIGVSTSLLLMSLVNNIRRPLFVASATFQQLYEHLDDYDRLHSQPVRVILYTSMSNVWLLPWAGKQESDQEWAARSQHHQTFINSITNSFNNLQKFENLAHDCNMQESAKPMVNDTLQILISLVEGVSINGSTRSKQILYSSLLNSIHTTVNLLPVYIKHSDVSDYILQFFVAIFAEIRVQMGVTAIDQMMQIFTCVFTKEQLTYSLNTSNDAGCKVVDRFMQLLKIIISEPNAAFKKFIPTTITLCIDDIYPLVKEKCIADVKCTLFSLLHALVQENWRFFFKNNVASTFSGASETVEFKNELLSIFKAFGESFMQTELNLFRQNLLALETLNAKWKLYHKEMFKANLLSEFLTVLLQVMIAKSHDLYRDEISIAIFNMASVDFDGFHSGYIAQFLSTRTDVDDLQKRTLVNNFQRETDLPSFSQQLDRFVSDLRYYCLCNSSLPANSVQFAL